VTTILTTSANRHRPGGPLSRGRLQAQLTCYSLLFDKVAIPDAQMITNPTIRGLVSDRDSVKLPRTIRKLVREGVIHPVLRNSEESLLSLRESSAARGVEDLSPRFVVKDLERLVGGKMPAYDAKAVEDLFKERALDEISALTVGPGGIPRRWWQAFYDYLIASQPLLYKGARTWLAEAQSAGRGPLSPRAAAILDAALARAYQDNVAIATGANFDSHSVSRGSQSRFREVDTADLPSSLGLLMATELLNKLPLASIKQIRSSTEFRHVTTATERWRSGDIETADSVKGAFEELARLIEANAYSLAAPQRSALRRLARSRARTRLAIYVGELGVAIASLTLGQLGLEEIAVGTEVLGLAFGGYMLHREAQAAASETAETISRFSEARAEQIGKVGPSQSGVSLGLVATADDKSGSSLHLRLVGDLG
jgi:hypothetical protein